MTRVLSNLWSVADIRDPINGPIELYAVIEVTRHFGAAATVSSKAALSKA
jgi:hypothetical protein